MQVRLTALDGVFIEGLLLVLTSLTLAEEEPPLVQVLLTSSSGTHRINITNMALKKLIMGFNN